MKEVIKNYIEKLDRYSLFNLTEIPDLDPKEAVSEMTDLAKLKASKRLLITRKGNLYKVTGKNPKWVSTYNFAVDYGSKINSSIKTLYGKLNTLLSHLPGGACITVDAVMTVTGLKDSRDLIQKELNRIVKKEIFEKVDHLMDGSVIYQKIDKRGFKLKKGVYEFIEFLRNTGTYEAFEKNFKIQRLATESKDIQKTLIDRKTSPEMLLCTAFWWNETPEGNDYWNKVDTQYREHLFSIHKDKLSSSQILEAFKKAIPEGYVATYSQVLDNLIREHFTIDD